MKMNKFKSLMTGVKNGAVKHSPELMIGLGIVGMISTIVMTAEATTKAVKQKELIEAKSEKKLTKREVVKVTWKNYIPAVITGGLSIGCIIGGCKVNLKRNAALATAYTISETALNEFRSSAREVVGDKKMQEIQDTVAKKHIVENPVSESKEVIITAKGNTLCYDSVSGRYFRSDIDTIKRVQNELNQQMMQEMYISLNEFYYALDLRPTGLGNELGWNVNNDGLIDIKFSSQIADNGEPCLVLDYIVAPRYEYDRLM